MSQRRLFLSAGHSTTAGRDRGATSHDGRHIEGLIVAEFRTLVFDILMSQYKYRASVDSNDSILSQTISLFQKWATPKCVLVDFHLNAASNPKAAGIECFVPNSPTSFELGLAREIAEAVASETRFPLRRGRLSQAGVKTESESARGSLGWMKVAGENVLVELFFVTNPEEVAVWNKQKHQAAKRVADVLWKYINM